MSDNGVTFNATHAITTDGLVRILAYDSGNKAYILTLDSKWKPTTGEEEQIVVLTDDEIASLIEILTARHLVLGFPLPQEEPK